MKRVNVRTCQSGATTSEYSFLAGILAVAALLSVGPLGANSGRSIGQAGCTLASIVSPTPSTSTTSSQANSACGGGTWGIFPPPNPDPGKGPRRTPNNPEKPK